jgi:hypothetical protein
MANPVTWMTVADVCKIGEHPRPNAPLLELAQQRDGGKGLARAGPGLNSAVLVGVVVSDQLLIGRQHALVEGHPASLPSRTSRVW